MKRYFLILFFLMLLSGTVSAKDVAYLVKTSGSSDVISAINELGYSYDVILDSGIPSMNFSNYAVILTQGDLGNKLLIPFSSKNAVFIVDDMSKNVLPLVWPTVRVGKSTPMFAKFEQLGTPFTINFSLLDFQAYTSSRDAYRLYIKPASVQRVAYSTLQSSYGDSFVAYSDVLNKRNVFFGLSEVSYWTSDTKKLFKNSLKWARLGTDFDGDGWYSDTDCNDNNASIHPNATEIAYDGVDDNCDGYDLADVDNDGYCKSGYHIQNYLLQCFNEPGNIGTDCNDNNASIHPGAPELFNGIELNCLNDAPVLAENIPNLTLNEDEQTSIDLISYFKDQENDNLSFSFSSKGSSMNVTFNGSLAIIRAIKDWNGNSWVIFKANDSGGFGLSNNVSVTVIPVNDAPVLKNISSVIIPEGDDAIIIANATDIDSAALFYSINDTRFSQAGNVFTWRTAVGNAGNYIFNVSVNDGSLSDSKIAEIIVLPKIVINEIMPYPNSGDDWIEIYNPRNESVNLSGCYVENERYNHYDLTRGGATLGGGSFIAFDYSSLNNTAGIVKLYCSEAKLDEISYSGIPSGKSYGRKSDGLDTNNASDWKIYDYATKGLGNNADVVAPVISLISPANNSLINHSYILFNYTATDNSASSMNCSFYSNVNGIFRNERSQMTSNGTMANFNANGVADGNYIWQVKCSDGINLGSSEIRMFEVDKPDAPVLSRIANITANETELVRIIANATDADGDALVYSVNDTRFLQSGNIFEWQTGYNDSGVYNVKVQASDGIFNASQNVKITILNKNRAPVIQTIAPAVMNEDNNSSILINASDADSDILVYSVVEKNTGKVDCIISGNSLAMKPAMNWNGNASCKIRVSDGKENAEGIVNITINPVNDPPVFSGKIADISMQMNQNKNNAINLSKYFSDIDSVMSYSANFSSPGIEIIIENGIVGFVPSADFFGNVNVTFFASDSEFRAGSNAVKVSVARINKLPIFDNINLAIEEDSGLNEFALNASDPDADGSITGYFIVSQSAGVACSVSGNKLQVSPALNFNGTTSCRVKARDNLNGETTANATITVNNVNDAPVIDSSFPGFNPVVAENSSQEFSVSWHDVDSSSVSLRWYVDGIFSGNGNILIINNIQGDNIVKVVVNDSQLSAEREWNVSVSSIPIADKYDGSTTNFSGMNDSGLSNVSLILEKSGIGKIEMNNADLRDAVDFNHYSEISPGLAALDTSYFVSLAGKIAKITLYGLGFDKMPVIYYNDKYKLNKSEITGICPDSLCQNKSYANGTLVFYSHFSSFKIGNTLTCWEQNGFVCGKNEICKGSLLNAVEDKCCSVRCSPNFHEIDSCSNANENIEIEINEPDTSDKFYPGDKINVEVKVRNNGEEDDDFDVTAYLYDASNDENLDDKTESISIDSGDRESIEIEISVPSDLDENNEFIIFAKVEGRRCNQAYQSIRIERKSHDVKISRFDIPPSVNCGDSVESEIVLRNDGKKKETAILRLENSALGISETSEISLDKAGGEDDSERRKFLISIPENAEEKIYNIEARAEFNGEENIARQEVFVKCEKQEIQASEDIGVLRLNQKRDEVKTERKNFLDRIDELSAEDMMFVIVDIFLGLGVIFIILYLIVRKR